MTLKKSELTRWSKLENQRLALGRKIAAIEKEQEPIEAKAKDLVRTSGEKGILSKWGYHLLITMVRCAVKWKDEFIRKTSADEAARLVERQPEREKLTITKAV